MRERHIIRLIVRAADLLAAPFVFLSALLLREVRRVGVKRMRISRRVLKSVAVFPIRDHILFVDSTHVIRPQGDVVYEYLELLPGLRPG